jgi:hypothetical protein
VWGASAAAIAVLCLLTLLLGRSPRDREWGQLEDGRRRTLTLLGATLWGVCIGAGGIIAWFGTLVALATRRLAGTRALGPWVASSAVTGLDAGGRFLVGGYAFPVGLAVAMFAVPWFLGWGRWGELPRSRVAARALRVAGFVLAGGIAAAVGVFVVGLTLVVRVLG